MRPLAGKTALVTGAARGIGRAIALRLAERRVRLLLVDRDQVGLAQTQRDAQERGVEAVVWLCDLTESPQIDALIADTLARWAGVDLLVNNAGVAHYGSTHQMSAGDAHRLLAVNLLAPVRLTHGLLPAMLARPEAHVLNVGSVLGLTPMPKVSVYCGSKHGLVGYSESLRSEYGRCGLGVTTLCPGFVRTGLIGDAAPLTEGQPGRRPPALVCVSVERVAAAAVRGVERNRRRVVVDPVGRFVRGAMAMAPGVFDWMNALGRSRRVAKKRVELAALDATPDRALRRQLGISLPSESQDSAFLPSESRSAA